jgi:hypothetical protein
VILLERSYLPHCTIGRLHLPGMRIVFTVEQPWRDNQPGESCIKEGRYTLVRDATGGHRWFKIPDEEVEPRSAIEFHPANRAEELRGCIAPGMALAKTWWGVERSQEACELMAALLLEPETLWIRAFSPAEG